MQSSFHLCALFTLVSYILFSVVRVNVLPLYTLTFSPVLELKEVKDSTELTLGFVCVCTDLVP